MEEGRIVAVGEKIVGGEEVAGALCRMALGRRESPEMKGRRSP